MLAVIAVLPIVRVSLWILGTMTIFGIPYNVVTALITALSIGITAIAILYALIAAIALVPPMLVAWAAYHEWRSRMKAEIQP